MTSGESNDRLAKDELEMTASEAAVASSKYYPNICLKGLKKRVKILNQNSQCRV
jgi:hypothetical protein